MSKQSELAKQQAEERRIKNKDFALRVKNRMEQLKLSKSYVARCCGVQRTTVLNWCDGNSKPDFDAIGSLLSVLDTTYEYLKSGTSYLESNAKGGISPETVKDAAEAIRSVEMSSGVMYTKDKIGDKTVEVCYRLMNNDSVSDLIPESSSIKQASRLAMEGVSKLLGGKVDELELKSIFDKATEAAVTGG